MDDQSWLELQTESYKRALFFSTEKFIAGLKRCLEE
jgi:hypothetical protein